MRLVVRLFQVYIASCRQRHFMLPRQYYQLNRPLTSKLAACASYIEIIGATQHDELSPSTSHAEEILSHGSSEACGDFCASLRPIVDLNVGTTSSLHGQRRQRAPHEVAKSRNGPGLNVRHQFHRTNIPCLDQSRISTVFLSHFSV
ncbi:hypothetical protein PHLGIDRAFT_218694 [Phlebiopsis gigantea 11061_1 CR5-6]|uniref:Uncharacterized protein n=1 Tax=Phlebiopsis gigantea (strain 11061_1 CR5-6) TaxID=745531 RepID=A0A0C3PEL8_PHLG1|nr:hypothetical protein PHLGIDRAFT_218694 [Phlebiopsis gigantea 11061_1 CR5-6]